MNKGELSEYIDCQIEVTKHQSLNLSEKLITIFDKEKSKDLKVATILLNKVLLVCRGKSHVPVISWHELQADVQRFVENEPVNIDEYKIEKIVKMFQQSEGNRQLLSDNSVLRQKNDALSIENVKLKRQNKTYEQLERGIKSLLSQREKVHKGK